MCSVVLILQAAAPTNTPQTDMTSPEKNATIFRMVVGRYLAEDSDDDDETHPEKGEKAAERK